MPIETAEFVVQRENIQTKCKGQDLQTKVKSDDRLVVQRGAQIFSFRCEQELDNGDDIRDDDLLVVTDTDGITKKVSGRQLKEILRKPLEWDRYPTLIEEGVTLKIDRLAKGGKLPYDYTDEYWRWMKYLEGWQSHTTNIKSYYGSVPFGSVELNNVSYSITGKNYCVYSTDALNFQPFVYDGSVGNFSTVYSTYVSGDNVYMCTAEAGLVYGNSTSGFKARTISNLAHNVYGAVKLRSLIRDSSNREGYYYGVGSIFGKFNPMNVGEYERAVFVVIENYNCTKVIGIDDWHMVDELDGGNESRGAYITKFGGDSDYSFYVDGKSSEIDRMQGWYRVPVSAINSWVANNHVDMRPYMVRDGNGDGPSGDWANWQIDEEKKFVAVRNGVYSTLWIYKRDVSTFQAEASNVRTFDFTDKELSYYTTNAAPYGNMFIGTGPNLTSYSPTPNFPTKTTVALTSTLGDRLTNMGDANGWTSGTNTPGYTTKIIEGWYKIARPYDTPGRYKGRSTCKDSSNPVQTITGDTAEYTKT